MVGAGGRQLPAHAYQGLRTATRALVKACGKLTAAADYTRVHASTVAAYYEPSATKAAELTWLPIDVAADLEQASGEPIVTRALAALSGHLLLRVDPDRSTPLARDFARIGQEAGELFAAYGKALADDGRVNAREAARILAETDDLLAAVMAARSELLATLDDDRG